MNIRKMGIGALVVLSPLFNACEKAAEKAVVATEKISTKNGKLFLSKKTVELFRERYSPVDTLNVGEDVSNAAKDSLAKYTLALKNHGNKDIRTGVNSQGKPFIVYTPIFPREAIQLTKGGSYEKLTFFHPETSKNSFTLTWRLNSNGEKGNNSAFHKNGKLKIVDIDGFNFYVCSGMEKLLWPPARFVDYKNYGSVLRR